MNIIFVGAFAIALFALAIAACETTPSDTQLSRQAQQESSGRAFTAIPPYIPTEYTAREDINWYLQEPKAGIPGTCTRFRSPGSRCST